MPSLMDSPLCKCMYVCIVGIECLCLMSITPGAQGAMTTQGQHTKLLAVSQNTESFVQTI